MTDLSQIFSKLEHAAQIMAEAQLDLARLRHHKAEEVAKLRSRLNTIIRYLCEQHKRKR